MNVSILLADLERGVKTSRGMLMAQKIARGRFPEEINVDVHFYTSNFDVHLLYLKIFRGRYPFYRPWIEIFGINPGPIGGIKSYFGSPLEDLLLRMVATALGEGESIFVEYVNDNVTQKELKFGVPEHVTRLGLKLLMLGFYWFKDWYFPEGFMEGGQKLQAEKPLDKSHACRQILYRKIELENFSYRQGNTLSYLKARIEAALQVLDRAVKVYGCV